MRVMAAFLVVLLSMLGVVTTVLAAPLPILPLSFETLMSVRVHRIGGGGSPSDPIATGHGRWAVDAATQRSYHSLSLSGASEMSDTDVDDDRTLLRDAGLLLDTEFTTIDRFDLGKTYRITSAGDRSECVSSSVTTKRQASPWSWLSTDAGAYHEPQPWLHNGTAYDRFALEVSSSVSYSIATLPSAFTPSFYIHSHHNLETVYEFIEWRSRSVAPVAGASTSVRSEHEFNIPQVCDSLSSSSTGGSGARRVIILAPESPLSSSLTASPAPSVTVRGGNCKIGGCDNWVSDCIGGRHNPDVQCDCFRRAEGYFQCQADLRCGHD